MAFAKPPAGAIAAAAAAMGVPPGKRLSVKNMLRARKPKRPKAANPDANDEGDHEYR